jgi:hypothetical protein
MDETAPLHAENITVEQNSSWIQMDGNLTPTGRLKIARIDAS